MPQTDPQIQTLRHVTLLSALRRDWPGSLILSCGLTPAGASLALAANIVGAACLCIDHSPVACRAALRSGAVDFAVNTLNEALRALKNEIRKGHPLSVALEADPATVLPEILDRGVLPELFTAFATPLDGFAATDPNEPAYDRTSRALGSQGALIVNFDGTLQSAFSAIDANHRLDAFTTEHGLHLETFAFDSDQARRLFDARLADLISPAGHRRVWIDAAPRHFRRSPPTPTRSYLRSLYLTAEEKDLLSHPHP